MVLIAGALTAFLAACGGGDGDKTPSAVAQPTSAAATSTTPEAGGGTNASIKIVSPADNWSASGDRVEVQVQVAGLKLDGTKIGQPAAQNPGVGHWHVYVDGKYAGLSVSDVVSLPNDAMPTIAAGAHEIKVQLHNTDHTPVVPEATDAVNVTFPKALTYTADATGTPSIKVVSPADGASVNGRVVVQVAVAGITLDGTKIGLPAEQNPGVGHWHVYVDGKYAGLSVSDVISLPNDAMPSITPGPHEIKVQLHHTDHTPLTPEVTDTINLTFK
jgi:hypothetical protein